MTWDARTYGERGEESEEPSATRGGARARRGKRFARADAARDVHRSNLRLRSSEPGDVERDGSLVEIAARLFAVDVITVITAPPRAPPRIRGVAFGVPGSGATATRGDFDDFAIAVVHLTLAVAFAVTRRGVVRPRPTARVATSSIRTRRRRLWRAPSPNLVFAARLRDGSFLRPRDSRARDADDPSPRDILEMMPVILRATDADRGGERERRPRSRRARTPTPTSGPSRAVEKTRRAGPRRTRTRSSARRRTWRRGRWGMIFGLPSRREGAWGGSLGRRVTPR